MTDKEQIKCKYKFQDKEKFDGKPYCTCFNEPCEDLSFVCDHNCQIYEDYKQLVRKTAECEELKKKLRDLELENTTLQNRNQQLDGVTNNAAHYHKALNDIGKIVIQDRNIKDVCLISTCLDTGRVAYDIQQQIIDIINKAKDGKNE